MTMKQQDQRMLPVGFEVLERFVGLAVADEKARYHQRIRSSMDELRDFYDTMLPVLDDAMAEVDKHPYDAMPDDVSRLYQLLQATMETSLSIEIFNAADVPRSVAVDRIEILEPSFRVSQT